MVVAWLLHVLVAISRRTLTFTAAIPSNHLPPSRELIVMTPRDAAPPLPRSRSPRMIRILSGGDVQKWQQKLQRSMLTHWCLGKVFHFRNTGLNMLKETWLHWLSKLIFQIRLLHKLRSAIRKSCFMLSQQDNKMLWKDSKSPQWDSKSLRRDIKWQWRDSFYLTASTYTLLQ